MKLFNFLLPFGVYGKAQNSKADIAKQGMEVENLEQESKMRTEADDIAKNLGEMEKIAEGIQQYHQGFL